MPDNRKSNDRSFARDPTLERDDEAQLDELG